MSTEARRTPVLFTPIDLRGARPRNRIVIPPMCQYSAADGAPNDWHSSGFYREEPPAAAE